MATTPKSNASINPDVHQGLIDALLIAKRYMFVPYNGGVLERAELEANLKVIDAALTAATREE